MLPLMAPARRLQCLWAGPRYPVRSSVWSASHGSVGLIPPPQMEQTARPASTCCFMVLRTALCCELYPRATVPPGLGMVTPKPRSVGGYGLPDLDCGRLALLVRGLVLQHLARGADGETPLAAERALLPCHILDG